MIMVAELPGLPGQPTPWEVRFTELHSGAVITAPVRFHLRSGTFVVA